MRQTPGHSSDASVAALSTLATQATLAPGRYQVEVLVNLAPAGKHEIDFRERSDGKGLEPCLSASLLRELGLREQGLAEPLASDERCVDLPVLVPDATYDLDPGQLQLALSIPQIALRRDVAGSVAPERWDNGINAAFVSYQASAQHFSGKTGRSRSSQDLYLNGGINLGGWRLRSSQSWRDDGEGVWRYNLVAGRYDGADGIDNPALWQATLARGGQWSTTLYGGLLGSEYYDAANLGIARDFGTLGAVSLDVTQARTDLGEQGGQVQGQSYSVRYGKAFQTGTSLRFAGYRYSTEGYREFDEAVQQRNASSRYQGNRRSRLESSIYQTFGNRNSMSLTLSQDDYWGTNRQRRQYQFQFNTQYRRVSINLYASQSLSDDRGSDRIVGLGVTIPLGWGTSTTASFDVQESDGRFSERATLNGGSQDNRLSYLASLANDEQQRKTASASVGYQTQKVNVGAGYTEADEFRSVSVNASGAVLAHAGGIVLGQYLGETTALVHVPDVPGVGVDNVPGGSTDSSGYILAPHMRPYRVNQVTLQTDQLGPDVEIENGATQVVPRRGAVALATFKARQVSRLILTLQHAEGRPLPFGTQVNDQQGKHLAVVGQAGQALIATDAQAQTLEARWGDRAEQRCRLKIDPATMLEEQGYRLQTLRCPTP